LPARPHPARIQLRPCAVVLPGNIDQRAYRRRGSQSRRRRWGRWRRRWGRWGL